MWHFMCSWFMSCVISCVISSVISSVHDSCHVSFHVFMIHFMWICDVRFGPTLASFGTKWDKSGTLYFESVFTPFYILTSSRFVSIWPISDSLTVSWMVWVMLMRNELRFIEILNIERWRMFVCLICKCKLSGNYWTFSNIFHFMKWIINWNMICERKAIILN